MLHLLPLVRRFVEPTRRQLLRGAALCAGLLALACHKRQAPAEAAPAQPRIVPPPAPQKGKVLPVDEWRALESAAARILPSDGGPGAREANVITFIDAQLGTRLLAPVAPIMRAGAELLDKWAQKQHGGAFAAILPEQQDAILSAMSTGSIPVKSFPQKEFFRLLHGLTLEGFLSDPIHGGNASMIGWKTIGFGEPHRRTADDTSPHGPQHHR